MEWSVALELAHKMERGAALDEYIVDLLEDLRQHSAVASHDPFTLSVRLSVEAANDRAAIGKAKHATIRVLRKTGFTHPVEFVRVEAETAEDLNRRLREPNFPELCGVSEAARILGISKQRVSQLVSSRAFPRPIVRLEATPVWRCSAILRFADAWERKSGRPRKSEHARARS